MAAGPMPPPNGNDPGQPTPSPGVSPAQQQVNPLQQGLAQLMRLLDQLGNQNPVVKPEMDQARDAIRAALQKTMMAARPEQPAPQQPGGGPPGGGGPPAPAGQPGG